MSETALVVLFPQADPLLAAHRRHREPTPLTGIPAHVTVLFPFRHTIDDGDSATIERIAAAVPAFDVTFPRSGRFPGEFVFLVPEPSRPFVQLTNALAAAFPDRPPYGGAYDEVVPHLTVADDLDPATAAAMQVELTGSLPLDARVDRLTMLQQDADGSWRAVREWPLGAA